MTCRHTALTLALLGSGCSPTLDDDLHLLFYRWEIDAAHDRHAASESVAREVARTWRRADALTTAVARYEEGLRASVQAGADAHLDQGGVGMVGAGPTLDSAVQAAFARAASTEPRDTALAAAVIDAALLLSVRHAAYAALSTRSRMGHDHAFGLTGVWFDGTGALGPAARADLLDTAIVPTLSETLHTVFDKLRTRTTERDDSRLGASKVFDDALQRFDHALLQIVVLDAAAALDADPVGVPALGRTRVAWEALRPSLHAVDPVQADAIEAALYPDGSPTRCATVDLSACDGSVWLNGLDEVAAQLDGVEVAAALRDALEVVAPTPEEAR